MKKKTKRCLLAFGGLLLIIGGFYIIYDKPLVCTKTTKLDNGVKIIDKLTLYKKNNKLNKIKVNKSIDLDEHTDNSYINIFKNQLSNTYKNIKDKTIYDRSHIVYMDSIITDGGYVLDGFNIILTGNVMTVSSNNDLDVAKSFIKMNDDYEELYTKLSNISYECE